MIRINTRTHRLVAIVGGPLDGDAMVTPLDIEPGAIKFRHSGVVATDGHAMRARYEYLLEVPRLHAKWIKACEEAGLSRAQGPDPSVYYRWRFTGYVTVQVAAR